LKRKAPDNNPKISAWRNKRPAKRIFSAAQQPTGHEADKIARQQPKNFGLAQQTTSQTNIFGSPAANRARSR